MCIAANVGRSQCAVTACIAEGKFVTDVFDFVIAGGTPDPSKHHDNGFNVTAECKHLGKGLGQSEKLCCGQWPIRRPFKTYGGDRGCCGTSIYDTTVKRCCADGIPKLEC